jgi:putative transposase
VYLATILDAYSRRCVGWNLSTRLDTNLTLGALSEALATREISPLHHSDRGMHYARYAYTERLQTLGIQMSMSSSGNAYDNAKAESFLKTLKQEEV